MKGELVEVTPYRVHTSNTVHEAEPQSLPQPGHQRISRSPEKELDDPKFRNRVSQQEGHRINDNAMREI